MATLLPDSFETVAPTEADALLARESSRFVSFGQEVRNYFGPVGTT